MKTILTALKNIPNVNYARLSKDKKQVLVSIKPLTVSTFNHYFNKLRGNIFSSISFDTAKDTKVSTIISFYIN